MDKTDVLLDKRLLNNTFSFVEQKTDTLLFIVKKKPMKFVGFGKGSFTTDKVFVIADKVYLLQKLPSLIYIKGHN